MAQDFQNKFVRRLDFPGKEQASPNVRKGGADETQSKKVRSTVHHFSFNFLQNQNQLSGH